MKLLDKKKESEYGSPEYFRIRGWKRRIRRDSVIRWFFSKKTTRDGTLGHICTMYFIDGRDLNINLKDEHDAINMAEKLDKLFNVKEI